MGSTTGRLLTYNFLYDRVLRHFFICFRVRENVYQFALILRQNGLFWGTVYQKVRPVSFFHMKNCLTGPNWSRPGWEFKAEGGGTHWADGRRDLAARPGRGSPDKRRDRAPWGTRSLTPAALAGGAQKGRVSGGGLGPAVPLMPATPRPPKLPHRTAGARTASGAGPRRRVPCTSAGP